MDASAVLRRIAASLLLLGAAAGVAWGLAHIHAPPAVRDEVSLAQRPTWPYAWLDAAGKQPQQAEALRAQAVALGPSERPLRTSLALQALQLWPQLSAQGREQAQQDILFALKVQPQIVLRTAFGLRREQLVCPLWKDGGDIAQVCANMSGVRRICDRPNPNFQLQSWCFEHGVLSPGRHD